MPFLNRTDDKLQYRNEKMRRFRDTKDNGKSSFHTGLMSAIN